MTALFKAFSLQLTNSCGLSKSSGVHHCHPFFDLLLEKPFGQRAHLFRAAAKQPPDDPGNPTVNFRGEKRSNETHESKTDPEALLARKSEGKESELSYSGNLLVENRNRLIVDAEVFQANGTAERDAALILLEKLAGTQSVTVGGDKGFDTFGFVAEYRNLGVVPHVAQNHKRPGGSAIDGRTARHSGYAISQRKRKRIDECFGWLKTIALMPNLNCGIVECATWTGFLPSPAESTTWCACEIWPPFHRCR
jgi:hypothetical protein